MKLKVERFIKNSNETIGKFYIDGVLKCFTLEDEIRKVKVKGETAIPTGTYTVGLRHSPRFSPKYDHEMLWVQNVPNFEFILIHCGNTDSDTEGCLLVGKKIGVMNGKNAVLESKKAYNEIYPIIERAIKSGVKVTIEYVEV